MNTGPYLKKFSFFSVKELILKWPLNPDGETTSPIATLFFILK
jgi:hypothetical protein